MKHNIMKGYIMFHNRDNELETLEDEYQKDGATFTIMD